tara:strand:+ start:4394 stop:4657 length:264 start_codon:yes stop_codon:yes gene_type:complete
MYKVLNILMIIFTTFFIFYIFKYYSSNKNITDKNYNRSNIEKILNKKTFNLPILKNDTDNVIEFNDSFQNELKDNKKRNFWDLLKNK